MSMYLHINNGIQCPVNGAYNNLIKPNAGIQLCSIVIVRPTVHVIKLRLCSIVIVIPTVHGDKAAAVLYSDRYTYCAW